MPMTKKPPSQINAKPSEDRRPTVFISYCREDKEHVDRLIAELNAAGYDCWIDRSSIKGGEEWAMAIADGIIKSDALIPVVTAQSLCHRWVKLEILFARKFQKPIIPWVLEDVNQQKESFLLTDCQWITLFDNDPSVAFSRLLEALPSPSLQEVKDANPRDARRRLEKVYLERLGLEELVATEKYTPMSGASERKIQPAEMRAVFELLPMSSKARQAEQERRRFENAVEEILKLRRTVLLGEPGGGKTTTIWKLAAELVAEALK
ncbi:MAG: TIR domain-containing protein, partial [Acidobacteria bacterium]|nr:TIR domain-containing protein [Acidobacteriota bacterium]